MRRTLPRFSLILSLLLFASFAVAAERIELPPLPNVAQPQAGVVTAGAVTAGDVDAIRATGIRTVIDLRVADETPDFDEGAAVEAAGLRYVRVPVHGADGLTRETVAAFDSALQGAEHPVLVHCASGNRVGALAALRAAWLADASDEEALAIGRAWGLKGLEPEVRRLLQPEAP